LSSDLRAELRQLLRLSWPIAAAQVGIPLMGIVDIAIVGRVSVEDLAGAAMGRSIGFSAFMLALGTAMGLEPLAAQAIGAREPERAWAALKTTLTSVLLMWVPLMACAVGITLLLAPFGVEPQVAERTRAYVLGQAPGLAMYGAFATVKIFLQAHGTTRPGLVAVVAANLVNVVVCNVLVRGDDLLRDLHLAPRGLPRLGALGAGLAASVASFVLVAMVVPAALAFRPVRTPPPVPKVVLLRIGIPIGLQMLAEVGVFAVVALLAGKLGKEIIAAHQVALSLASFTYMGALGVAGAAAVRVGHAIGAGASPRRIGLLGIAVGIAMTTVPAIAFAIFPRQLVGLFTHDARVQELGVSLLRIAGVFQLFDGMQAVAGGALRGAGDVRYSFLVNVAAYWVIGFPVALVLAFPFGWGARGLWWGLTLGLILASFALTARFVKLSARSVARVGLE
jgi:MATE family multidrug resistance protein